MLKYHSIQNNQYVLLNNELYQLKVDVGMLNTVNIYWADVSIFNPLSEFVVVALMKG